MRFFRNLGRPSYLTNIARVFDHRIDKFGNTPKGVLWKNIEGQQLRFEVLAGILDDVFPAGKISINDFGCGYGAFFDFLVDLPSTSALTYTGFDMSQHMVRAARHRISDKRAIFRETYKIDAPADFTFVSGTFNLKLDTDDAPWNAYVKSSLRDLWSMSSRGMAFNMLDKNHREQGKDLYYADAKEFQDFCSEFSADVTLVDDYPLDEWTIFVRR